MSVTHLLLALLIIPTIAASGQVQFRTTNFGVVSAPADVSITDSPVNNIPVPNNDSVNTNEDTFVNIEVLANDTDIDGDSLNVTSLTPARNGSAYINANNNTITYTPNANFFGTDTFNYTISDGKNDTSAQVTVNISSNDSEVLESVGKFIGTGERGVGVDPATNAIINIFFEGPSSILEDDHASVFILGSLGDVNGSALKDQIVSVTFCNRDNKAFCYYSGNLETDDVGRYEYKPENGDINLDKGTYIAFANATADIYKGRLNATKELVVEARPPSIPAEIWGAFSALIVGFLVPSAVNWGNGWRQRKNLREYIGRVDDARNNRNTLRDLENKILIELGKNCISQSHYELIKARIDGYMEHLPSP